MEQETRLQEQELGYLYTLKLQECIDNFNRLIASRNFLLAFIFMKAFHSLCLEPLEGHSLHLSSCHNVLDRCPKTLE